MFFLRQNTATQEVPVTLVSSVDGYTPKTGITAPTKKIAKTTGAFANMNDGTWAEDAYGWYTVQFNAADSNTLGMIKLHIEKSGCRNFDDFGYVLPANIYDSWFSTDKQQVDITQIAGVTQNATNLSKAASTMVLGTVDTAGFAPTTTEFEADDITEATDNHYNGRIIIWTSGALLGQATDITDYTLTGGRGHFTVTATTEAPANNDTFIMV